MGIVSQVLFQIFVLLPVLGSSLLSSAMGICSPLDVTHCV